MPFLSRLVLVTSSYAPLFMLLTLVSYEEHSRLAVTFGILAVAPTVLLVVLLCVMWRAVRALPLEIVSVADRTEDVAVYATTYLLPFLALTFDSWQTVVALFGFIGLLVLIYLRARVSYLNPLLLVLGFRLFEVEYKTRGVNTTQPARRAIVISWWSLKGQQRIEASRIERPGAHLGVLFVKKVEA